MMIPNRPNSKLQHDKLPLAGRGYNRTYPANSLQPQLVLDAGENYFRKDGSRDSFSNTFTHSRAGNATVLDADGNLKWAPHNLLTYSEDFSNAAWVKTSSTATADYATAPDGTETASRIDGTGTWLVYQNPGNFADRTIALWVKSNTGSNQSFRFLANSNQVSGNQTATGEWQRFTFEPSSTGSASGWGITRNSSGDDADLLVWGAHLYRSDLGGMQAVPTDERGLASSSTYLPTTSAARYLPRRNAYTYVDGVLTGPYLQLESSSSTNLRIDSNNFGSVNWFAAGSSTTENATTSPDGTSSAWKLVESAVNEAHRLRGAGGTAASVSGAACLSIFAKAAERSILLIREDEETGDLAYFNLSSGTVTKGSGVSEPTDAFIEDWGNGWYRCSIVSTQTAAADFDIRISAGVGDAGTYLGDGTSGIFIYGAQLETGSIPTSYIPTSGSTATRAAETLTIPNPPWPATVEVQTNVSDDFSGYADQTAAESAGYVFTSCSFDAVNNQVDFSGVAANVRIDGAFDTATTNGSLYEVTFTVSNYVSGSLAFQDAFSTVGTQVTANGSFTRIFAKSAISANIRFNTSDFTGSIDNISVKEITPRGLAIAMDGLVTYADTGTNAQATLIRWYGSANERLQYFLDTVGTETGRLRFDQAAGGVVDVVESAEDAYSPGVNQPFSIASRHGDNFINGAVDGVALTADLTPTILPALSATSIQIGSTFNGYINTLRIWPVDLTDAGISEASQ